MLFGLFAHFFRPKKLNCFDEPAHPAVSMTESHTRWVSHTHNPWAIVLAAVVLMDMPPDYSCGFIPRSPVHQYFLVIRSLLRTVLHWPEVTRCYQAYVPLARIIGETGADRVTVD